MATFFPRTERSYLERLAINVLKAGDIPEHVAFIMDGNRRYAQRLHVERAIGHSRGFEKMAEALSWCRDLGIKQATVYAFSIENFKRSPEEVDCLLNLFREQFAKLIEEFDKFAQYDVCVRFFGKLDLLPLDIRQAMAKIIVNTNKHKSFYLNVCLSYTAREEICRAINDISTIVQSDNEFNLTDINDHRLTESLYSSGLKDPDILLRTSGEIRLSDFLLWQTSFSHVAFVDDLWPDLSIWSFLKVIGYYQFNNVVLKTKKQQYQRWLDDQERMLAKNLFLEQNGTERFDDFLIGRRQRRDRLIETIVNSRMEVFRKLLQDVEDGDFEFGIDSEIQSLHSLP